jgi:hypothetical protein
MTDQRKGNENASANFPTQTYSLRLSARLFPPGQNGLRVATVSLQPYS